MKTLKKTADEFSNFDKTKEGYIVIYEMLFSPIRDNVKKVLEIGVQSGKSILLWRNFFTNAQIYGWDIDPSCQMNQERVIIQTLNHDDKSSVISALDKIGSDIDIIIEDGSHNVISQQRLLAWCLPYVKSGGIYITEDLGTSFPARGGSYGLNRESTNSAYKCFERLIYSGKFQCEFVSKEEQDYVTKNINAAFMYSTIRHDLGAFTSLSLNDWPTFPIFVALKF